MNLDEFIKEQDFPSEVSQASTGRWSCLREDDSRELKRCLIGFSQSGSDKQIFYEFDFQSLSWVKENSFQYEILGHTRFQWVDDNQILVMFDEISYHNYHNPKSPLSLKEAVDRGISSSSGLPIKLMIWKRGEIFPGKMVLRGNPSTFIRGSAIRMKGRPKEEVLGFYEYYSENKNLFYLVLQTNSDKYKTHLINLPEDCRINLLAMDDKNLRLFFHTKSQWSQGKGKPIYDERDILITDLEIVSPEKIQVSPPRRIFRLPENKGIISSLSVAEGKEFDPTDDKIILGVSHNVNKSIIMINHIRGEWKSSLPLKAPLDLKYKSISIREEEDQSLSLSIVNFKVNPHRKYNLEFE